LRLAQKLEHLSKLIVSFQVFFLWNLLRQRRKPRSLCNIASYFYRRLVWSFVIAFKMNSLRIKYFTTRTYLILFAKLEGSISNYRWFFYSCQISSPLAIKLVFIYVYLSLIKSKSNKTNSISILWSNSLEKIYQIKRVLYLERTVLLKYLKI